MNLLLAELVQALPARTHAVLVLDRAGWHLSDGLQIPSSITLAHLPSHAPELNPVEKVWPYLRDRWLSHLVLQDHRAVLDAACHAWNALCADLGRIHSLNSFPWLPASVCNSRGWYEARAWGLVALDVRQAGDVVALQAAAQG